MREIQLTNSPFKVLVDDEDYERLLRWGKFLLMHNGYVRGTSYPCEYMHITLMKWHNKYISDNHTDHIDHNKLNNQMYNLRSVSNSINRLNAKRQINNTTGYNGVVYDKRRQRYQARITINSKTIHLGMFATINEAIIARKQAEIKLGVVHV